MVKQTINQKAQALPEATKQKIRDLVGTGRSIVNICNTLKLDYNIVQAFLWQEGRLPWRGARSVITRRLKSLVASTKRDERQRLADEIRDQVDYIYYTAKQLSVQLDKIKKSIT